jgi:hypothetical protein
MSRSAHTARRTNRTTDRYLVTGDSVHPAGEPPYVVLTIQRVTKHGGADGPSVQVPMTVGEAFQLGRNLAEQAAGLLASERRPWDGQRVPFYSRPRAGRSRIRPDRPAGSAR